MIIETERLLLREYTLDDYEALFEIVSDAETMQHYSAPFDEERTRGWITWNLANYEKYGFGLWAVVLKETGEFIGDCGITIQNIDGEMLPEIGYHMQSDMPACHGKGYAKEALTAVVEYMKEIGATKIHAGTAINNIPSVALLKSLGFELTDTEQVSFFKDNAGNDIVFEGGNFVKKLL